MRPGDASPGAGGGAGPAAYVDRAAHLTEAFDWMIRRCEEAVLRERGLHHVAHYSAGVYDFAVDVLHRPELAGRRTATLERKTLGEIGRRLSFKVSSLDHALEDVRTGRLIRTVLHTQSGVLYCNSVLPGGYVIALLLGDVIEGGVPLAELPVVREADRAAGELATALRHEVRLGSFNPGGWRHEHWLTDNPAAGPADPPATLGAEVGAATPAGPSGGDVEPYLQGSAGNGEAATLARCRAALDPDELSYVAYYPDDSGGFSLDLFEHESVRPFFTHITVDARREFYAQFGRQFTFLGRQLAQLIRPLFEGRLLRVVLDVEQGAIYYYRLASGRYIVGVTLNQQKVSHGDDRMAELAVDLSAAAQK